MEHTPMTALWNLRDAATPLAEEVRLRHVWCPPAGCVMRTLLEAFDAAVEVAKEQLPIKSFLDTESAPTDRKP